VVVPADNRRVPRVHEWHDAHATAAGAAAAPLLIRLFDKARLLAVLMLLVALLSFAFWFVGPDQIERFRTGQRCH
jgi:hypothetical protein